MAIELINEIKKAMENHELQAYYQPQYDTVTEAVKGAEALVRWIKPDGTVVPPCEFIPVLEENNAVNEVDWYIAEQAIKFIAEHRDLIGHTSISVNFSRDHIREPDSHLRLAALADKYDVPHKRITAEVTESAMVIEGERIGAWLENMHSVGFRVAIDDFGSGLSSLQFVKDMPFDILKIDKSLLSQNCGNEKERTVLESIFYFASRLNMTTVCEGVETMQQLSFMRTCGCNRIQGYLFSKPLPEAEFIKLLKVNKSTEHIGDILAMQNPTNAQKLLMEAVFIRYPLIIFSNLSKNSYYMMAYDSFSTKTCPAAGIFDELIEGGAKTMAEEDVSVFVDAFERKNLLRAYEEGKKYVRVITRQRGDDGIYRRVETTDYFVKSPSSDDILVITLSEALE